MKYKTPRNKITRIRRRHIAMRKILLDLNLPEDKKGLHEYIAETLGFPLNRIKTLDDLYGELLSISEPTAVGIFMPLGDPEDLDFDHMLYIFQVCDTFRDAEADNESLAIIMGDLVLNPGYEGAYDDYFEDVEISDDYDGAELSLVDEGEDYADDEDDDTPGDHDVVMLDINKFRR